MNALQQQIETMYLDWVNNFLTVNAFAEHYGISVRIATAIIEEGRATDNFTAEGVK